MYLSALPTSIAAIKFVRHRSRLRPDSFPGCNSEPVSIDLIGTSLGASWLLWCFGQVPASTIVSVLWPIVPYASLRIDLCPSKCSLSEVGSSRGRGTTLREGAQAITFRIGAIGSYLVDTAGTRKCLVLMTFDSGL